MIKKSISILLCMALLGGLSLTVLGAEQPYVNDFANLLDSSEAATLEQQATELADKWSIDAVILTVDSLNGNSAQTTADNYYDQIGYAEDGVLFLLAMEEREWYISTCGSMIYALTDYGLYELEELVLPYLQSGGYYDAFNAFLQALPGYMEAYESGDSVDGYIPPEERYEGHTDVVYQDQPAINWLISIGVGLAVAALTIVIMRSAMNTKKPQYSAGDYLKAGSFHLYRHQDLFLYSQISKTRRQENNASGGGGGGSGVHRSSGGVSHGGRGGKF